MRRGKACSVEAKPGVHALEVVAHLLASLEAEVGEVESADDVDGLRDDVERRR
jgi:hypothetical protein